MGMMAEDGSDRVTTARERLVAANLFMRYDYAWKANEFKQCTSRLTGVTCRILYLYTVWQHAAETKRTKIQLDTENAESAAVSSPRNVYIDANGYPEFEHQVVTACELMGFDVITNQDERAQANLVFVYISPHGEERVDDQYAGFQSITQHHESIATETEQRPIFCFLLGEADFLEPPATTETERLRGLSGFAISQRFTPILQEAQYSSAAHFAVEFVPQVVKDQSERGQLNDLMNQFGCMDHNMIHHTEKWELYAPTESLFCQDEDVTQADEDEARFWLELTKGKTCDQCHEAHEKLFKCSRCTSAFYCSRDCQKVAWKLHKQLCGVQVPPAETAST
ncbi:hypothetical protein Poli38472_002896 [Pythium oligandrum]|uniref:MYND-type domain-containing protein n=1 Tax=Pythium oligandrum TaxID=41045 RepID=A0A8K1FCA2_PYTOL|nr:hypothetical protein Poli38472_002896 [Pythium oligandrum]|eukprot:TMW56971.1 hypothetical protein Poli38472_002896 [Pythium oligandrum]